MENKTMLICMVLICVALLMIVNLSFHINLDEKSDSEKSAVRNKRLMVVPQYKNQNSGISLEEAEKLGLIYNGK